jgi:hypothetical protein
LVRRLFSRPAVAVGCLLALAAAAPAAAQEAAPTLDEVLARYYQAKGGLAAWDAIESVEIRGTYTSFSEDAPFVLRKRRPASYRWETSMLENEVVEATDGETAWTTFPLGGLGWPVEMTPPELTGILGEAEFDSPLVHWREKGHTVDLAGRDDLDGQDVWRLEVTRRDGARETWLLDASTYLEAGRIAPTTDWGAPQEMKVWYSDFRPVAGVMFPHQVEAEFFIRHRVMAVDSIQTGVAFDDALFEMPLPEGMAKLAPLAGEWTVTVASRPHPRAPWTEEEGTSTIVPVLDGRMLEEHLVYPVVGRPIEAVRLHSWDRFHDRYRLAHGDDVSTHLNVFEGSFDEAGKLVVTNLETGTEWTGYEQTLHGRWSFSEIGPDGFVVELEESGDAGETWDTTAKLTYRRAGTPPPEASAATPAG